MSSLRYDEGISHQITEVTKKVSNSFYQDSERLEHPVSPACPAIAPLSFPCHPGSSTQIDGYIEGPLTEKQAYDETRKELTERGRCTYVFYPTLLTDYCSDVALLEIFYFYRDDARRMVDLYHQFKEIEAWHTLVHVCRKWRNIVFGSPRRLDLRLYCTEKTPVRRTLEVWPLLPIVVYGFGYEKWGVDNLVAALEQNDRICRLNLGKAICQVFNSKKS